MDYYAGIDVSLESSSVCIVDATGRIVREAKISSEHEALTAWLKGLNFEIVFRDSSDGRSATRSDGRLNWPKVGLSRA